MINFEDARDLIRRAVQLGILKTIITPNDNKEFIMVYMQVTPEYQDWVPIEIDDAAQNLVDKGSYEIILNKVREVERTKLSERAGRY